MKVDEGKELFAGCRGWAEAGETDRVAGVAVEDSSQIT
jgi:hypothetical protein